MYSTVVQTVLSYTYSTVVYKYCTVGVLNTVCSSMERNMGFCAYKTGHRCMVASFREEKDIS